jgi:hypothetical protein
MSKDGKPINKRYLEVNLPTFLQESIDDFLRAEINDDSLLDCYSMELKSDINVCEVEQLITEEQAWYLREKYFGFKKGEF